MVRFLKDVTFTPTTHKWDSLKTPYSQDTSVHVNALGDDLSSGVGVVYGSCLCVCFRFWTRWWWTEDPPHICPTWTSSWMDTSLPPCREMVSGQRMCVDARPSGRNCGPSGLHTSVPYVGVTSEHFQDWDGDDGQLQSAFVIPSIFFDKPKSQNEKRGGYVLDWNQKRCCYINSLADYFIYRVDSELVQQHESGITFCFLVW